VTATSQATVVDGRESRTVFVRLAAIEQSLIRLLTLLSRKQASVLSVRFDAGSDEHVASIEFSVARSRSNHVIDAMRGEIVVIAVEDVR
jgi:hypothetical protein